MPSAITMSAGLPLPSTFVRSDGWRVDMSMVRVEIRSVSFVVFPSSSSIVPAKLGKRLASCAATVDHDGLGNGDVMPYPDREEPDTNVTWT